MVTFGWREQEVWELPYGLYVKYVELAQARIVAEREARTMDTHVSIVASLSKKGDKVLNKYFDKLHDVLIKE